jgi:hypothetical protein
MFAFCEEVDAVLRQSGWTPERSVDISQWTDPLVKEGYEFHPTAETILKNLGGLRIIPPHNEDNLFFPSEILFDPFYAASGELDRVEAWQAQCRTNLAPLGEYHPSYLLLSAPGGKIYGAREKRIYLLGDSIEKALELRILARRKPVLISSPAGAEKNEAGVSRQDRK